MEAFPILRRELLVRARNWRTHAWRVSLVILGILAIPGATQLVAVSGLTNASTGRLLFNGLSAVGILFCLVSGPVLTADCLSHEKRTGTLPLLMLSPLPPLEVVISKIAAASLPAVYALAAFYPVLAFGFFLGGVPLGEYWRMLVLLGSLMGLSLMLCGCISAVMWSGRRALALSILMLLVLNAASLPWEWRGTPSPLPGYWPEVRQFWAAAIDQGYRADTGPFWKQVTGIWGLNGALLIVAAMVLPHRLHGPVGSIRDPLRTANRFSNSRYYRRAREKLLRLNPVEWVAWRQTSTSLKLVSALLAVGLGVMVLQLNQMGTQESRIGLLALYGVHGLVKIWVAWETTRVLARDHAEGLLEPLLSTPLSEHQIVHGWIVGLRRLFAWPILLLAALDLFLWIAGDWDEWGVILVASMELLVFDVYALFWTGMYYGLISESATRALLRVIGVVLVLPWLLFLMLSGLLGAVGMFQIIRPSPVVVCIFWLLIGNVINGIWCLRCSLKLGHGFRFLVSEKT